jgi:SAM-dependent methyltransferase
MQQEDIWDVDAARRYDTPGTGMFAPEVLGPTVDRLAGLAGVGGALEFAIGTGRVAVPLAGRGIPVTGIELSRPMIEQLRAKADEAAIPVVIGDMATVRAPGEFTLVYLVCNTISNLLTQGEQVACFRNAARHLRPGGRFAIELWVPELRKLPPGQLATVWHSEPGYIGLDTYDVLHQQVVSHHFRFGAGRGAELFRSPHRYIWPAELDLMADRRLRAGDEACGLGRERVHR